jgi:hypothetical protein
MSIEAVRCCPERNARMTRLFLDAREIAMPGAGDCSLQQLLEYVEGTHLPPQAAIRQVDLDGRTLLAEELVEGGEALLARIQRSQRIDILTSTVADLAAEAMHEASAYVERVERAIPSLAWAFRSDPSAAAYENLRRFYEGFYWVHLLLDRLESSFGIPLAGLRAGGYSLREHYLRMASVLKLVVELHERRDSLGLAELLEQEMNASLPLIKELLAEASGRLTAGLAADAGGQEIDKDCVKPLTP